VAKEVVMPALGMSQETGVLLQWLKAEGEAVAAGEPLMEVETDKATVEVEAPASGRLASVTARPGDEIPVGQVIAFILSAGEQAPPKPAASERPGVPAVPPSRETVAVPPAPALAAGGRLPASPKARRLAGERGVELQSLSGSGPGGAILAADVPAAAPQREAVPPPAPEALDAAPVSRAWQVMVQRLTQSWTQVPHFYLTVEARAGQLVRWREQAQERVAAKLTYTDLLVRLVALALRQHPRLNGRWEAGQIALNDQINLGLAVAVEEGLVVPVLHQADRLGLAEVAVRCRELVGRAQAGKLTLDDLRDGTFTLSNLGMYGIDAFNAILNPPQAAILAVGRIAERVVPVAGLPSVQPMVTLTLSCDHRVVDGARAARFLQSLVGLIEDPLQLLLAGF
jgi:pyruvate dehydrogenase E2 component (dihydrolipoamide acetyltransferase)